MCHVRDAADDIVGSLAAIALLQGRVVVDVEDDGVGGHILVIVVELLGVAVEVLGVVEAGDGVAFRGPDDLAVLRELDAAPAPGHDHAGRRVGLLDEVDGPEVEAVDLAGLVAARYDDGNLGEVRGCLHALQELFPRHVRHDEVEDYEGEDVRMLPHEG